MQHRVNNHKSQDLPSCREHWRHHCLSAGHCVYLLYDKLWAEITVYCSHLCVLIETKCIRGLNVNGLIKCYNNMITETAHQCFINRDVFVLRLFVWLYVLTGSWIFLHEIWSTGTINCVTDQSHLTFCWFLSIIMKQTNTESQINPVRWLSGNQCSITFNRISLSVTASWESYAGLSSWVKM